VPRSVVELGGQLIDSADVYGPHTNELLIKAALRPYPNDLVIATNGGFVRGGYYYDALGAVGNVNYLRQAAYTSAHRLGVDSIDLYYLHSGRATDTPFEDQVGALAELRLAGLLHHIGLSNVTLEQLRIAQTIVPIAAVTALFNLTMRAGSDLLAAAEQDGIAFAPWHPVTITDGPLATRAAEVITPIARVHQASTQQVALARQLHVSTQTLPIPGTTSIARFKANFEAASLRLTAEELAAVDGTAAA
jgi:pyridoxine 4-dehydrogenase